MLEVSMLSRGRSYREYHPDLRAIALVAPPRAVSPRTLPVMRALTRLLRGSSRVRTVNLGDGVGVRLAIPESATTPKPALLWIHGGGYLIGTAAQEDWWSLRMAERADVVVASVDYRLAPEHPYPTPVEDCHRALSWLLAQPEVDAERVAIGGSSAGGGLAASLAFLVRDRETCSPTLQLLTYPMLDDRATKPDPRHRVWDARANAFGWRSYLGSADPAVAVPARREDLRGLPPTWIGVGELDLFAEENREYARRLAAAGVPCALELVPGAFHGFDMIAPFTGVSREFFDSQCAAVKTALHT
jgi:acetyl esterase/lipase